MTIPAFIASDKGFISRNLITAQTSSDFDLAATLNFTQSVKPAYVCVENNGNGGTVIVSFNDGSQFTIPAGNNDYISIIAHNRVTVENKGGKDVYITFIDTQHAAAYLDHYRQQAGKSVDSLTRALLHFDQSTFYDAGGIDGLQGITGLFTTYQPTGGKFSGQMHIATHTDSPSVQRCGVFLAFPNTINFLTGNWTIDFWLNYRSVNQSSGLAYVTLIGYTNNIALLKTLSTSPTPRITLNGNDPVTIFISFDSAWHHIAVVKIGKTLTMYYDGVLRNSYSASTGVAQDAILSNVSGIWLGGSPDDKSPTLDISEFRCVAYPAWLDDFTPPVSPYS